MSQRTPLRSIAVVLAAVTLLGGAWLYRHRGAGGDGDAQRGSDPALLLDRIWVDSRPEKYTDYTNVMLAISDAPLGVFQKASAYQATTELFEYKRREARFLVHFPQTGKKREVKYRITECKDLPPFDLCLDFSQNPWGGPRRYYGMADPDKERTELGALRHMLEQRLQPSWQGSGSVPR